MSQEINIDLKSIQASMISGILLSSTYSLLLLRQQLGEPCTFKEAFSEVFELYGELWKSLEKEPTKQPPLSHSYD